MLRTSAALDAAVVIEALGLTPHPEGGYFREVFRAASGHSTHIDYLLEAGGMSALHRVRGRDEIWHHYAGATLTLHVIGEDGHYEELRLGPDVSRGEVLHAVVPADAWQAAEAQGGAVLSGCTVAPAFDFAAFEMPSRARVLELLGDRVERSLLERLTRA